MPAATLSAMGLSPRVRGNPPWLLRICRRAGSIPACAGEPRRRRRARSAQGVYPRVCGGTRHVGRELRADRGLSPRVRGNRQRPTLSGVSAGSIPACAGEPRSDGARRARRAVYPRVCGGTILHFISVPSGWGLSPRVRGNRGAHAHVILGERSIPACAGEPAPSLALHCQQRVYPRVCGGTHHARVPPPRDEGLSPRVRGNLPAESP